jgi:hypothetical protein
MKPARASRALLLATLAALAGPGCLGASPPLVFFALAAGSGDAGGPALASRPELGLVVGPLEVPRYLDRPELVTRDGAYRLVPAGAHLWGGSLSNEILRVVADDLGRLLGTARVAVYPAEPRFPADFRILLDVREFEGVPGDHVTLRMRWTVASMRDGRAVFVEESVIEQPIASKSFDDLVGAQSAALGSVNRRIAARIAELPAR